MQWIFWYFASVSLTHWLYISRSQNTAMFQLTCIDLSIHVLPKILHRIKDDYEYMHNTNAMLHVHANNTSSRKWSRIIFNDVRMKYWLFTCSNVSFARGAFSWCSMLRKLTYCFFKNVRSIKVGTKSAAIFIRVDYYS